MKTVGRSVDLYEKKLEHVFGIYIYISSSGILISNLLDVLPCRYRAKIVFSIRSMHSILFVLSFFLSFLFFFFFLLLLFSLACACIERKTHISFARTKFNSLNKVGPLFFRHTQTPRWICSNDNTVLIRSYRRLKVTKKKKKKGREEKKNSNGISNVCSTCNVMEIEHTLWIKTSMRLITGNSNNFFTTPGSIRCAKWKWRKENKKGLKKKKKKKEKRIYFVRSGTELVA